MVNKTRRTPSIGKQSFDFENSQNVSRSMIEAGSQGTSRILAGLLAYKNTRLSSMYGEHTTTGAKFLRAFNMQTAAKWYDRFRATAKEDDNEDNEAQEKAIKSVHTTQSKQSAILVATWKRLDSIHGLLAVVASDVLDIKKVMTDSGKNPIKSRLLIKKVMAEEQAKVELRKKFAYKEEVERYGKEDPLEALKEEVDKLGDKIDALGNKKDDKGWLSKIWDMLKMSKLFGILSTIAGVIATIASVSGIILGFIKAMSDGMKKSHMRATDNIMTGDAWKRYEETGDLGEIHTSIEQSLQAGERDVEQRRKGVEAGTVKPVELANYEKRLADRKEWLQKSEELSDEQKKVAADYIKARDAKNAGVAPADWRNMKQTLINECSAAVKAGKMTRAEANDYLGLFDAYKAKCIAGELSNPSIAGFKAWAGGSQGAVTPETPPVKTPVLTPPTPPTPVTGEKKRHWWKPDKPKPAPNAPTSGRGTIGQAGTQATGTLAKKPASPGTLFPKTGMNNSEWDIYRNTLASIESEGAGGYSAVGGSGNAYDGRYQLGKAAKTDAARILGIPDPGHTPAARQAFRDNPELQEAMFAAYTVANHGYMNSSPIYRDLPRNKKIEALGYAHNQGHGKAKEWLRTGKVGKDGFGTKGTRYSEALAKNLSQSSGTMMADNVTPKSTVSGSTIDQQSRALNAANSPSAASPTVIVGPTNNTVVSNNGQKRKSDRADVLSNDNALVRIVMRDSKHPVLVG